MKKNLFTLCMMLLLSMLSFAQGSLTISGVVTEKKTGEPIIGASILLVNRPEPLRQLFYSECSFGRHSCFQLYRHENAGGQGDCLLEAGYLS